MKKIYKDFFFYPDILILFILLLFISFYLIMNPLNAFDLYTFILGLIFFIFSEYLTHRFLFHMKAPKNLFMLNLMKRLHYDHHSKPDDLKLLFLPIWYSLPNFFVLCVIFFFINEDLVQTVAFGGGLVSMLLIYEWKHYIAHRSIKPKSAFGKWLKKHHLLHHYKNENYWFGVSNPLGDLLFGTLKDEKEVETSDTAKNLENRRY